MFDDPIVEEIRRIRHAYAAQFNNDLSLIFEDLCRLQRESGRNYVKYPPRLRKKQPAQDEPQPPDQATT